MKHRTEITPMNCGYGTGLTSLMTFNESEYNDATARSIYCKDVDISWFKMKSVTATPYLEPVFYGLKKGDILTVEFEAVLLSGQSNVNANLVRVDPDYKTKDLGVKPIPDIEGYYKFFRMSQYIDHEGIGTILNLRPSDFPSEMIIRNVVVEIETSNPKFSMHSNIVAYRNRTDFMKMIDFYGGTNLNSTYHGMLTLLKDGKASFPDGETLKYTNAGTTLFKGVMCLFNGHLYRPVFSFYLEYIAPRGISLTTKNVKEDGTFTQEGSQAVPATTTMTKKIFFFNGGTEPSRKTFFDGGMVSSGTDLTVKNVRIAMPQFDDSVKRDPNQLDELYTNLSAKLR